jgi:hypothetical protein
MFQSTSLTVKGHNRLYKHIQKNPKYFFFKFSTDVEELQILPICPVIAIASTDTFASTGTSSSHSQAADCQNFSFHVNGIATLALHPSVVFDWQTPFSCTPSPTPTPTLKQIIVSSRHLAPFLLSTVPKDEFVCFFSPRSLLKSSSPPPGHIQSSPPTNAIANANAQADYRFFSTFCSFYSFDGAKRRICFFFLASVAPQVFFTAARSYPVIPTDKRHRRRQRSSKLTFLLDILLLLFFRRCQKTNFFCDLTSNQS